MVILIVGSKMYGASNLMQMPLIYLTVPTLILDKRGSFIRDLQWRLMSRRAVGSRARKRVGDLEDSSPTLVLVAPQLISPSPFRSIRRR